ncbi:MAG TPA: outer membrane beta-barrel protein [Kiritimatiellia bacterium]|nr:outer membrane beta-barrel protein [Kiritimatiellia bacterium]
MKRNFITALGAATILFMPGYAIAQTETGMTSGSWMFRPYLDLRAVYDDNVYQSENNKTDDFYAEPEVGLRFSSGSSHNLITLSGGAFYSRREYASESDRSHNSYGQNLSLSYGSIERTSLQLVQGYRVLEDTDRHADNVQLEGVNRSLIQDIDSINQERAILDLGAGLQHRLSDRTGLGLAILYTSLDYDKDAFIDIDGIVAQGEIAYRATDKASTFLVTSYKNQEQDGDNQSSDAYAARLGIRTKETDKVTLRASVGAERYERTLLSGEKDESDNFSFSANARWAATDKLTVTVGGYNGTQLSSLYRDNALDFVSAFLGLNLKATDNVNLSLRGTYRVDDYVDAVVVDGTSFSRKDTRLQGTARIEYQPPAKYLQLYAQITAEDVDSDVPGLDYSRVRAMVGARISY